MMNVVLTAIGETIRMIGEITDCYHDVANDYERKEGDAKSNAIWEVRNSGNKIVRARGKVN